MELLKIKTKPMIALLLASLLVGAGLVLLNAGSVFADHSADIEQCGQQPDRAECIDRVLERERQRCRNLTRLPDQEECLAHVAGAAGSSFRSGVVCGEDGVKLGVSVNDNQDCVGQGDQNPIFEYLGAIVRFLSVGVGIVVTAMIVVGGIQYSAAGGNPQATEAAKKRIFNAIIALVMYIFMVGILNFLVPGGVL